MKKSIFVTLLSVVMCVLASMSMSSCSSELTLETAVAEVNKDCPQDLGDGLTFTNVKIDGNYIVYTYSLSNDLSLDNIKATSSEIEADMLKSFQEDYKKGGDDKEVIDLAIDAKKNFKYVYMDANGGSHSIELDPNKFK